MIPSWQWLFVFACVALTGCGSERLDDTYGRRRGLGAQSVAGTAALAEMIELRGGRASTWSRISPKLDNFQVIFWFPDDFRPPTLEQRVALEQWLMSGIGRSLIYVGRDFDAVSAYWKSIMPQVEAGQWEDAINRAARAKAVYSTRRLMDASESTYARWFTMKGNAPPTQVTSLQSDDGWDQGVDVKRLELRVETWLAEPVAADLPSSKAPPTGPAFPWEAEKWEAEQFQRNNDRRIPQSEVLLDSNAGPLVRRIVDQRWGDSQVLVVTNGGFLLNLPLVNVEHRKLASRLLDEAGVTDGQQVVLLESGPDGPPVYHEEPEDSAPTGLELFTIWPIGMVMIHLLGLGVLSCFVLFPIFGRARGLPPQSTSDFGQHIEAVGELLSNTSAQNYVTQQLKNYHLVIKRDSGVSHASGDESLNVEADMNEPSNIKQS